jgi:hypothetical protein
MALGTLNTILNTAPIIIQGATRLVKLLKQREQKENPDSYDIPANLDDMKVEIQRLHKRLDTHDHADYEQVKLIEELARQNEAIATSLRSTVKQLHLMTLLALVALLLGGIALLWHLLG